MKSHSEKSSKTKSKIDSGRWVWMTDEPWWGWCSGGGWGQTKGPGKMSRNRRSGWAVDGGTTGASERTKYVFTQGNKYKEKRASWDVTATGFSTSWWRVTRETGETNADREYLIAQKCSAGVEKPEQTGNLTESRHVKHTLTETTTSYDNLLFNLY